MARLGSGAGRLLMDGRHVWGRRLASGCKGRRLEIGSMAAAADRKLGWKGW